MHTRATRFRVQVGNRPSQWPGRLSSGAGQLAHAPNFLLIPPPTHPEQEHKHLHTHAHTHVHTHVRTRTYMHTPIFLSSQFWFTFLMAPLLIPNDPY